MGSVAPPREKKSPLRVSEYAQRCKQNKEQNKEGIYLPGSLAPAKRVAARGTSVAFRPNGVGTTTGIGLRSLHTERLESGGEQPWPHSWYREEVRMKLPNGDRAVVELAKLSHYCLNEQHLRGRHKARVFASALGITTEDAEVLRQRLLDAATEEDADLGEQDDYGQRYVLDFLMTGPKGSAKVRSVWIVLVNQDVPRLLTCYVL
jgi:hypothetical protein